MPIDAAAILRENEARHRALNSPYSPLTGEGCQGERVRIDIKDAPDKTLWLPRAMMECEPCRLLLKYGSISGVVKAFGGRYAKEMRAEFWTGLCELRYGYDFEYFCFICVVIRDKISSRDIPFVLNRGQRRVLDRLERMRLAGVPIRVIVLKARQWGCSTLIQMYMLWIQIIHKRNWNSVVCAHVHEASRTIRAMYYRAVTDMIPVRGVKFYMKTYQGAQNIKEVTGRGCLITVGTAEAPDSVRSQDIKMAHFSEMALYPDTEANSTLMLEAAIVSSIPPEPLTLIARESTARGVGDYFYEVWSKAKAGETSYEPVFVEWYLIDIYRKEFKGSYFRHNGKPKKGSVEDFIMSMNEYELNLFNNHPECVLENINWRRLTAAGAPSESIMKQEFPSDDIEAFQDSGQPAFRGDDIEGMKSSCRLPVAVGTLASDGNPASAMLDRKRRKDILKGVHFVDNPEALEGLKSPEERERERSERNRLCVWEFPCTDIKVSNRYLVVFDPQRGLSESADWGVIAVFDRYWMQYGGKPEVVAQWRGRIDRDISVWIAAQIAVFYNNALLVVESNIYTRKDGGDYSEFIFDTIADYYGNLYSRTPAEKIVAGDPVVYGFNTNTSTRPMIIADYATSLREKNYVERDVKALLEARTYAYNKNGKPEARRGHHDDILMTRMIGLHVCFKEMPLPCTVAERKAEMSVRVGNESDI